MNVNHRIFAGVCILAMLLVMPCISAWAGPFDEDKNLLIGQSDSTSNADNNTKSFENSISKGLDALGKAIDKLANDIRGIAKDSDKSSAAVPAKTNGTAAQSPNVSSPFSGVANGTTPKAAPKATPKPAAKPKSSSKTADNSGKKLGGALGSFIDSLSSMFKAIVAWVKAEWTEITGPSIKEAPITHTINVVKTDLAKHSVKSSAAKAAKSTISLGTAIGNFFKNLFS
ncbi:MAG: hypothetical protein HQM09_11660 [Candidatus Riflebacteria bacterium]|nr:hypothetical protein [Candidatus Riflebacteria bacterium]